ncbi:MAG TPA: GAF domain-containing protein [Polyangiaceae bacterium]
MSHDDDRVARVQRLLAAVQAITHIGSWEWDARTNVVEWSDELYRIYGFEPRSRPITYEFFLSRVHPGDRDNTMREVRRALEHGGPFAYIERIQRPDGATRVLDTSGDVVRDAKGAITGLIGTCRDVTDERVRDQELRLYADIVKHMQIAVGVWEIGDPNDPAATRLVAFNPAAEVVARAPMGDKIGRSLLEVLPYAAGGRTPELLLEVARDGRVKEAIIERSRDSANPNRAVSMKAFPLPGGRVGLAVEDITPIVKARRLREAEYRVLELIATGAPLREILEALVLAIEDLAPPTLGSILFLDADGRHVSHAAAPHLPEAYTRKVDGLAIGPHAGSCGTAAYEKRQVVVEDIETDPLWADYRDLARAHGLRACWSTPILDVDGRVLGTFALYYRQPRAPTDEERELIARATHLAGIAITRAQLEEQLRALSARAEEVREEERTGISREIHDELGQALTALKMDLAWLARRISGESSAPGTTLLEKIESMSQMTDDVIDRVRRISAELRPGVLDDLGLLAAIEWEAQRFEERTGAACVVASNVGERQFRRDLSTAIFRIAQEALTNVARHARATHVAVRLETSPDGRGLLLEVRDDGVGISDDAARSPTALGLLGMRERARRLAGTVSSRRGSQGGTVVTVEVPLDPAGKEGA